jgi:hypothetical protein
MFLVFNFLYNTFIYKLIQIIYYVKHLGVKD